MPNLRHRLTEQFFQFAAGGWLPRRWFAKACPESVNLPARTGRLQLEIVSHCWKYSHLQDYQLSSLVLDPPHDCDVTMTVFHSEEDQRTVELLRFFEQQSPPNVTWNWWALPKEQLFRRAIGRNLAAKATSADWIWFTDCDQLFREGCLDALQEQLQGRQDMLVFPTHVHCTPLLEHDSRVLTATSAPAVVDIDPTEFVLKSHAKAIGALQILHGDVARLTGYCEAIPFYQQPVEHWHKTYEDRAFRWLLGTDGVPIHVPGIYRIEHVCKGRYAAADGQPNFLRRVSARLAPRAPRQADLNQRDAA